MALRRRRCGALTLYGAAPWLLGVLGVTLLAALGAALATVGLASALAFALATGILFGANAGLTKLVADQLALGWTEPLLHWQLYAMAATGPGGFLLSQRAFQVGRLLAPVNSVISTVDPVVATAIGIVLLGEQVAVAPAALAAEAAGAVATVAGIALVARRSARLIEAEAGAAAHTGHPVGWG